ncbi:MAG TPA: hypothetical protein VLE99_05190 [Candidatus Saccharimonadales bacterium]|nr:hypothetical protein [Candidatus Saccharimonadales bacterium]
MEELASSSTGERDAEQLRRWRQEALDARREATGPSVGHNALVVPMQDGTIATAEEVARMKREGQNPGGAYGDKSVRY